MTKRAKTKIMIEFSTVYGRFYRDSSPVTGRAMFIPSRRTVPIEGTIYSLRPLIADIEDGVLMHNGTPGISLPASVFGITWGVSVTPVGFTNVIQSYPGDIISLGD